MSEQNGVMPQPVSIEEKLPLVLTEGYKPSLPPWSLFIDGGQTMPQVYLFREIELMLIHPVVRNALDYYKGGISGAEFEGPKSIDGQPKPISQNQSLAEYVYSQCRRWWDRGVPKVQNGYEYGWIGGEHVYSQKQGGPEDGLWQWEGCVDFHPRDCFLLTHDSRPVGVRIKNVVKPGSSAGTRDLWFAEGNIPAKGLWYVHRPRYNRFYGQSQLLGAWKPWRRLAWKDAAETVIDAGFYRQGYGGPVVRYPEEDLQTRPGSPATTLAPDGTPFRYARDVARQMSQWAKSGAGIGLPSTTYPSDMGGKFKWDFEWSDTNFNGEPLISYINYLIKQIREGVGVPSELIEAAETGSGYSGRAIPLEGFLQLQQQIANAMLAMFVQQVLRPMALMNRAYFEQFGSLDFEVCVANLLETKLKAAMNPGGAAPGMRAGEQQPGAEGGDEQQEGAASGANWKPHQSEGGEQGWISRGGLVRYTQGPPDAGMSLEDGMIQRVRAIADKILAAARAA